MTQIIVRRIALADAANVYRADKPRGGVCGPTTASPQGGQKGKGFLAYTLRRQHAVNMKGDVSARQGAATAIRDANADALNARIAAQRAAAIAAGRREPERNRASQPPRKYGAR